MPQLPEMTFGGNKLEIKHSSGFSIEFNAVDALRLVDSQNDLMKVAMAKEWKESRCMKCLFLKNTANFGFLVFIFSAASKVCITFQYLVDDKAFLNSRLSKTAATVTKVYYTAAMLCYFSLSM